MDSSDEREYNELRMDVRRSQEAAKEIMQDHLSEYLSRNPDGTFVAWIAELHPENVSVDERLLKEGSEWMSMWRANKQLLDEMTQEAQSYRPCRASETNNSSGDSDDSVDSVDNSGGLGSGTRNFAKDEKSHSGLIDLVVGTAFVFITISFVFSMELVTYNFLVISRASKAACTKSWEALPRYVAWLPALIFGATGVAFYVSASAIGVSTQVFVTAFSFAAYLICGILSLSNKRGSKAYRMVKASSNTTMKEARRRLQQKRSENPQSDAMMPDSGDGV